MLVEEGEDAGQDGVGRRTWGEHVTAVANAPDTHNMVVCTLCSCYPWTLLGIPPGKSIISACAYKSVLNRVLVTTAMP